MLNSQTQAPAPAQTDELLESVNIQLAAGTFDPADTQLLATMVESLADGRGMVRLGFVEAFGKIGQPAAPYLQDALANHPNPVVRRSCGKALAKISYPQAVPTLINALLNDADTVVRSSAAGALAKMGPSAVPALLEVIASDSPETAKGHAAWALAFIGSAAAEKLYEAMNCESADVRCAAAGAIANIAQEQRDEHSTGIIISALSDAAPAVRAEAAAALGQLAHQPAVPQLIERIGDSAAEVRKAAALALAKIGDPAATEPLQAKLAGDPDDGVRQVAGVAISLLKRAKLVSPTPEDEFPTQ